MEKTSSQPRSLPERGARRLMRESVSPKEPTETEGQLLLPGEIRWLAVAAALLLLGLATAFGQLSGERLLAVLLLLGGGALLAWHGSRVLRRWQAERARQRLAAEKAALRQARRERVLKERARRRAERATQAEAALHGEEARARRHQETAEQAREAAMRRAERDRAVATETERLLALADAELWGAVADLFARQGRQPIHPEPEADCDLLLTAPEGGAQEVARCVPVGRRAGSADVQALEAWRQQAEAERAYLIAMGGFTPGAVRLSQSLPITLVEAHLLAHWRVLCTQS